MNTIVGTDCNRERMFDTIGGWTTQFDLNGNKVGGNIAILTKDPRLQWHMKQVGGVKGKRILELGPLEGAHTKMMIEAGAREVIAIEGLSDCFLRCLIVKEAFELTNAKFIFGDFCSYVENYCGEDFDIVSAAGVLYHQKNPAKLIFDLVKITNNVFVWSQVASDKHPSQILSSVEANGKEYFGKINNYAGGRLSSDSYCGGLSNEAFWMYPDSMRQCFQDAGFFITEIDNGPTVNGNCLLFIAHKNI